MFLLKTGKPGLFTFGILAMNYFCALEKKKKFLNSKSKIFVMPTFQETGPLKINGNLIICRNLEKKMGKNFLFQFFIKTRYFLKTHGSFGLSADN